MQKGLIMIIGILIVLSSGVNALCLCRAVMTEPASDLVVFNGDKFAHSGTWQTTAGSCAPALNTWWQYYNGSTWLNISVIPLAPLIFTDNPNPVNVTERTTSYKNDTTKAASVYLVSLLTSGCTRSENRTITVLPAFCGVNLNMSATLTKNYVCAATAVNIAASNIILNCNGYSITYANSTQGYGINNTNGYSNITIQNCNLYQGNDGLKSAYPIFAQNAGAITLTSVYTQTNNVDSKSIYFKNVSQSSGQFLTLNSAIYLENSTNITLKNVWNYAQSKEGLLTVGNNGNNTLIDAFIKGSTYDLYGNHYGVFTLLNVTFNTTYWQAVPYLVGEWRIKWYMDVRVIDWQGGISMANVSGIANAYGLQFSAITNSSGNIIRQNVTERQFFSTNNTVFWTPYNITVTNTHYANYSGLYNFSNNTDIIINLNPETPSQKGQVLPLILGLMFIVGIKRRGGKNEIS